MAQPMTQRALPIKGAQNTFVAIHGMIPIMLPFQKASKESNSCTGIEKATVQAKKIRIIHDVIRFVCLTQTWCVCPFLPGASKHAKDMPAIKQPHKCVPKKCVIVPYAISKLIMIKNKPSSSRETFASSLVFGSRGRMYLLIAKGQNLTAMTMATPMKTTPIMGLTTVFIASKSPLRLKRMLKSTNERMSSTKAAVMMAWPKSYCSTPTSPSNRSAMPTLVGAKAVPTATASGRNG
mmetsp:Transcript_74735/g.216906  ORF Transcript_74735/g.216906 Transcript_74735/m.216906 type:complete len:236 (-) Transcript_74735:114-821(-)